MYLMNTNALLQICSVATLKKLTHSRDRGVYQILENVEKEEAPFLQEFTTLLPEEKNSPKCIYVHSDGSLNFNGKLNGEIKSRQIEIRISDDGKRIVLIPDGKNNHKFTKSGRTKNTELIRTLKKKHIGVPATFEMERYMEALVAYHRFYGGKDE